MIHQWIGFFVASKHINYILHEFAPVKYSNSKKRIHNKNFGAIVETTAQFSLVTKPGTYICHRISSNGIFYEPRTVQTVSLVN